MFFSQLMRQRAPQLSGIWLCFIISCLTLPIQADNLLKVPMKTPNQAKAPNLNPSTMVSGLNSVVNQAQALQKPPTAQELSDLMRQIKEYGQQFKAVSQDQRIGKLIELQTPQGNNMGIADLATRLEFISKMSSAQLQGALPKKELISGFLDIIGNISIAFTQLKLSPDAIAQLQRLDPINIEKAMARIKGVPKSKIDEVKKAALASPIVHKIQDNINALIDFAPTAEQLAQSFDTIATLSTPKMSTTNCVKLLEQMEGLQ